MASQSRGPTGHMLWRRFLAECLGTFVMVLFGAGATAQSVLSNRSNGGYLSIHFGWGLAYFLGCCLSSRVSGGHLNPIVTVSLNLDNSIGWLSVAVMVLAQYLGALLAGLLVFLIYWDAINWFEHQIGEYRPVPQTAQIFSTYPSHYNTVYGAFFDQFLASAFLLVCLAAIVDKRNKVCPSSRPLYYGVAVVGVGVCLGCNVGMGVNPARDLSPRLVSLMLGWGGEVFTVASFWSFLTIIACHLGGIAGVLLYRVLIKPTIMENIKESNGKLKKITKEKKTKEFKEAILSKSGMSIVKSPLPSMNDKQDGVSVSNKEETASLINLYTEQSPPTSPFKFGPLPPSPEVSPSPSLNRMERITECTENVTTDTETESIASNENFTLRKRKHAEAATLRISDKHQHKESSLTKKGLVKLQKDLVKRKDDPNQGLAPPPPPPPPPPPVPPQPSGVPPPLPPGVEKIVHEASTHVHHQSPTSPCDCPAYLHDRESPLVISQVRQAVMVSRTIKHSKENF